MTATTSIDPRTTVGPVRLTVADLPRSRDFYENTIGLQSRELDGGALALGQAAGPDLVELAADASAPPFDPRRTGLFHMAILLPSRRDLAVTLHRLAERRWPLTGASDHLVSEALYLRDPDGNGIEIYRDRPRDDWRHRLDGEVEMATLPLDLDDILGELSGPDDNAERMPDGTTIGHVHLQVSDLAQSEAFYAGGLGFDVTTRGYPGALFVSAGGYHHHLGLNTWNSRGASPQERGAIGLRDFSVVLPDQAGLDVTLARLEDAGYAAERDGEAAFARDPAGNGVVLATTA